jgi:hypothetical protein
MSGQRSKKVPQKLSKSEVARSSSCVVHSSQPMSRSASAIDLSEPTDRDSTNTNGLQASGSSNSISSTWFSRPGNRKSADGDVTRQTDVAVELGDNEVNAVGEEVSFLIATSYSYITNRFFRKLLCCIWPCCGCCCEWCSDSSREKNFNECYGCARSCAEKYPA